MDDLISRQAAIDEIDEWIKAFRENGHKESAADACLIQDGIIQLPSAQRDTDEWCKDCKEYDNERHCCPRWNRVIRETLKDAQPERKTGKWIKHAIGHEHTPWGFDCSECGEWLVVGEEIVKKYNYCPNCGADMRGEQP